MPRLVLLVEPDVDELGALASKLRSHGLEVAIADGLDSAAERASSVRVSAILLSDAIVNTPGFAREIANHQAIATLPRFVLVDAAERAENELPRSDAEAIATRMYALGRSVPAVAGGDFRGDLQQVSVPDLVQLLGANRRSGTLSVSTPGGQGEVRLLNGEVVDAVYARVDGEKAVIRLLAESDGTFAFVGGTQPPLRRIERSTSSLLMDGMRQLDEARSLIARLDLDEDTLLAIVPPDPDQRDIEQRVLEVLATPHTLSELLDVAPGLDLEVLTALSGLLADGSVRRFGGGTLRTELADRERMSVLAALAQRLARPGFEGAPRLALAGSQRHLAAAHSALGRITDAAVVHDVPAAPVPHPLASLRLTETVSLEIVALPLVDAFAPLWALVLPGCVAVARIDDEPHGALEAGCELHSVPLVDGRSVLGDGGEAQPGRLAALVRVALERASGNA
jgi:hypothetical protein